MLGRVEGILLGAAEIEARDDMDDLNPHGREFYEFRALRCGAVFEVFAS